MFKAIQPAQTVIYGGQSISQTCLIMNICIDNIWGYMRIANFKFKKNNKLQ